MRVRFSVVLLVVVFSTIFFPTIFFSVAWAANSEVKVKVVDPQSAAVAGAQVSLVGAGGRILDAQTTSAEGIAVISARGDGPYQIKVLAPGFAAETVAVSKGEVTVSLRLATGAETVVVSATRTAVVGEAAGADVDTLNSLIAVVG